MTFEQAFEKVKMSSKTESAYAWDAKNKQLVEKPADSRTGTWSKAKGSWLFMWADAIINQ